jgi:hypothetical protein
MNRLPPLSITVLLALVWCCPANSEPIDVGSRLELFVDNHLIDSLQGDARVTLNRPCPREVAITHDQPWEGNNCGYTTVFQDGDLYRMYYRTGQFDLTGDKLNQSHRQLICYAESKDGVHWTKPELGLFEFEGSKKNNIIWDGVGRHNFAPMKDTNPDCPPEALYKALGGLKGSPEGDGLFAFKSPDGIHWSLLQKEPVVTEGYFDSQNLAFWDSERGEYREYHRSFKQGRDIMTSTSGDFIHWTKPTFLKYTDGRKTELYTNQITPYFRAPHILLGFPTRYITGLGHLTPLNARLSRVSHRYGDDYTDGGFMAGRDRLEFRMWGEAFIRPGPVRQGRWLYGGNYQNWGLVVTQAFEPPAGVAPLLPEADNQEISVYAYEGGWVGPANRMRRYTLRIDGFVSVQAPASGGELITKPLKFTGQQLVLNFATSAAGHIQVELQTPEGKPLPGHSLADSESIYGDTTTHTVKWKDSSDLTALAGRPVRLRFVLHDADLYSLKFE